MYANNNFFQIDLTCKHIIYRNAENNFTIMDTKILYIPCEQNYPKSSIVVKGIFDRIEEQDSFRCYATWVYDEKYGKQLDIKLPIMIASSDIVGMKHFLRRFVPGVGKATVEKIVNKYGTDSLNKIRENVDNLTCIKGISAAKANRIRNELTKSENIETLSLFLFKSGISSFNDIVTIYDKMGEDAQDKIMSNPYSICDHLSILKFPIADKIALNNGISPSSIVRVSKIVHHYLYNHCLLTGDMYVTRNCLYQNLPSYISKKRFSYVNLTETLFEDTLNYMEELNTIIIEDTGGDKGIYLKPLYTIESNSSNYIRNINIRRISPLKQNIYDAFFEEYTKNKGIEPDEVQKFAVKVAYENRLSILTGGPGTGKTQTIKAIIAFIKKQSPNSEIVLCAPTGRAAKRMSELTGQESYTIHRLLGLTGSELYDSAQSYDMHIDFLICDESSMIDFPLFHKLITAVAASKNTSLILVGDKDQLPPVGAGFPFKDMIESGKIPTVKLEKLFRQASQSQINKNAKLILKGVTVIGEHGLTFDRRKQDFLFFETSNTDFIRTLIIKSIEQLMDIGIKFDDIMVLSPINKSALGVESLNQLIQNHFNPPCNQKQEYSGKTYVFRVHDRVMATYNDYDSKVFNGDIGTITNIDDKSEEITIAFDSWDEMVYNGNALIPAKREVIYPFAMAEDFVLANAVTIHKAQGSEYPVVIMPLSPMFKNLSRNMIYTAITRSKSRFLFIGDRQSLINGILNNNNTQRLSKLKDRL